MSAGKQLKFAGHSGGTTPASRVRPPPVSTTANATLQTQQMNSARQQNVASQQQRRIMPQQYQAQTNMQPVAAAGGGSLSDLYTWTYTYGSSGETVTDTESHQAINQLINIYRQEQLAKSRFVDSKVVASSKKSGGILNRITNSGQRRFVGVLAAIGLALVLLYVVIGTNSMAEMDLLFRTDKPVEKASMVVPRAPEDLEVVVVEKRKSAAVNPKKQAKALPKIIHTLGTHKNGSDDENDSLVIKSNKCQTSGCRIKAAQFHKMVDLGVDPCKDFYGHVCTHWQRTRKQKKNGHESMDTKLSEMFIHDAYSILTRPSRNIVYSKIRSVLLACAENHKSSGYDHLQQGLLSGIVLDNWPYVSTEEVSGVSISTTLARLIKYFGSDPIFGIQLTQDSTTNATNNNKIVVYGPNPLIGPKLPNQQQDWKILRTAVNEVVGSRRHPSLKKFDITKTEQTLQKAVEYSAAVINRKLSQGELKRLSIKDLPKYKWISWDKLFDELVGKAEFVYLADPDVFKRIESSGLFKEESALTLANYLGFRALLVISPFLTTTPQSYSTTVALEYLRDNTGLQTIGEYDACIRFVNRIEPLFSIQRLSEEMNQTKRLETNDFLKELETFTKKHIATALNVKPTSRENHLLNNAQWQMLRPHLDKHSVAVERLVDAYTQINDTDPEQTISSLAQFIRDIAAANAELSVEYGMHYWKNGLLRSEPAFRYPWRHIEIPINVFDVEEIEHDDLPHLRVVRFFQRISSVLYRALALRQDKSDIKDHIQGVEDCIVKDYSNLKSNENRSYRRIAEYHREAVEIQDTLDVLSINAALWLYKQFTEHLALNKRLESMDNYGVSQQFFLEYARSTCESSSYNVVEHVHGEVASAAWYRVNGALRHIPEFGVAFNCSRRTPLNPSSKCNLHLE